MLQQLQGMHRVAAALQQPAAAAVALLEGVLGLGPLQGEKSPKSVPTTAAALVEGLKPVLGQLQVGILQDCRHAEHAWRVCETEQMLESCHSPSGGISRLLYGRHKTCIIGWTWGAACRLPAPLLCSVQ